MFIFLSGPTSNRLDLYGSVLHFSVTILKNPIILIDTVSPHVSLGAGRAGRCARGP
jgi:hypothetical protein